MIELINNLLSGNKTLFISKRYIINDYGLSIPILE